MQLRAAELEAHLAKTPAPAYAIHGDEPLLALEAADAVRAAARRRGFAERVVLEPGRHFDWSELTHAAASLSLFGAKKLIELRLPGGKPGPQGGAAIAAHLERRDKIILSLSGTGRVREFRLRYSVNFRLHDGHGREYIPLSTVELSRDVTYSDTEILAKESEETLLFNDMQADAVQQLLRRLAAAHPPVSGAS